ncbi:AAA family ATPase [Phaeobacter inhibens]|uniref:AAA family ATPase n=1 Tax=Phaeobacter inhibens TaxID=221822 RepID=UPI0013141E33|nr:AAA family ATPase [Phaeobacter inhibens]
MPGIKGRDGKWFSFDWVPYEHDEADLHRWAAMGAGVGIKTGQGLYAIDADTMDEHCAAIIRDAVAALAPDAPIRVGRFPKALYLVRVTEDVPYTKLEFGPPDENGNRERVELLGDRRFFVAEGVHPKTKKPYSWPREITPFDQLPVLDPADLSELFNQLRAALPEAQKLDTEGDGGPINQESLAGDLKAVRQAVAAIPNTSTHFPSREHYRDMGYAIKAALPDEPYEALEIFNDWCDRWAEGSNDPDVVASDWRRMKPPYRRGASWLYQLAEQHGDFNPATAHFTPIEQKPLDPFDQQAADERAAEPEHPPITATPFGLIDPTTIPKREWLYGNHYIRKFVSATVAPSGVGKSSLTIVEALAMASGKPLLGEDIINGPHRVWLWNGEDPMDELQRRVSAAMIHYGITHEDINGRLFVDTGREKEIVLAAETRDGATILKPVASALTETLLQNKIDAVIVDPFVSTHRVSENDNGAIDIVTKEWARIADNCRCSVELVHHVRKLNGEETTVEHSRGAVSLLATSRSARAISRMTKREAEDLGLENMLGRLFRFSDGKNNLALPASGGTQWMKLASVGLGNGEGEGLDRMVSGDSVGVVEIFGGLDGVRDGEAGQLLGGGDLDRLVAAVGEAQRLGANRQSYRAGDMWVGRYIARALELDVEDKGDRARIKRAINKLIAGGYAKEVSRNDAHRTKRLYIELTATSECADNVSEMEAFG